MTIRQMIRDNPGLFYSGQTWYQDEDFLDLELSEDAPKVNPDSRSHTGMPPEMISWGLTETVPAVVLVALYVQYPRDPIWGGYFWTSCEDHLGQRIFVGSNGDGLEIHRHLRISSRFGVPAWTE